MNGKFREKGKMMTANYTSKPKKDYRKWMQDGR